ncbi:hypothetical protein HGRIS_001846 [Hohenbuehelia grisea]|uniref:Protein kinase domain-containing protein n=1 Tax=Hohenbuehelia grisea TaxID=104357 RepID=A0ABR3JJ95_9AGAR
MSDTIFPCKPLTSAHNWGSGGQFYNSVSMRSAIREELKGKVRKNDESIFRRLGIDQVSDAFTNAFSDVFARQTHEILQELKVVVASAASGCAKSFLTQAPDLDQQSKGRGWKTKMCPPLQRLCDVIVEFTFENQPLAERHVTIAPSRDLKGGEHTIGFPRVSPDGIGSSTTECKSWMDVDWFMEINSKEEREDVAAKEINISEAVCQAADYARLHISSRPFQLFSVGLLIFGLEFMIGIFDRDGVTLSPVYSLDTNLKTFVKVVRRLVSPHLTNIALGRDPTVSQLPLAHPLYAVIRSAAVTLRASPDFPSFVVSIPKELTKLDHGMILRERVEDPWVTIGPPVWVSFSLIGRGTNIWRVARITMESGIWTFVRDSGVFILKDAWRNSWRTGEAAIYGSLPSHPTGVARFLQGGDVVFPSDKKEVISAYNLRNLPGADIYAEENLQPIGPSSGDGQPTAVLHRLVLQTIGRPLWDFVNYVELMRAFRAAITGHEALVDQGILHRDISPGNIMISAESNPTPGEEGFLMDLEFAKFDEIVHVASVEEIPHRTTWATPNLSLEFHSNLEQPHGTIQFMASEILESLIQKKPVAHKEHHDLESFAWVFAYVVFRRLLRDTTLPQSVRLTVRNQYDQSFGGLRLDTVLTQRKSLSAFELGQKVPSGTIPETITAFMGVLSAQVHANSPAMTLAPDFASHLPPSARAPRARMTHRDLLVLVDLGIAKLETEIQFDE